MLVIDSLLAATKSLFDHFTRPITTSSGIFIFLRFCSVFCGLTALLCIVNNYKVIDCITDGAHVSLPPGNDKDRETWNFLKAASTLCYMQSSFAIVDLTLKRIGGHVVPSSYAIGNAESKHPEELTYTDYYQWVPFVLVFLLCGFWLPEKLWELSEKGLSKKILNHLDQHMSEEEMTLRIQLSANYFVRNLRTKRNFPYALIALECLSVLWLWSSIFLVNFYLGGKFLNDIPHCINLLMWSDYGNFKKFIYKIFPKVTKCSFYYYGPSGSVQLKDFICTLSLNVLYEKIFMLLFVVLLTSSLLASVIFLWHLVVFLSSWVRKKYLIFLSWTSDLPETKEGLEKLLLKTNIGDEFLIFQFRSQMNYFNEWLKEVQHKMQV